VASFSELEPAKLLPVNRVDLLTINLDQNPHISDPTKGRLEKCVEAVFVMRDPLERAAIVTQRAVRRFLKWKAEQKRLEATCTIQTQVEVDNERERQPKPASQPKPSTYQEIKSNEEHAQKLDIFLTRNSIYKVSCSIFVSRLFSAVVELEHCVHLSWP